MVNLVRAVTDFFLTQANFYTCSFESLESQCLLKIPDDLKQFIYPLLSHYKQNQHSSVFSSFWEKKLTKQTNTTFFRHFKIEISGMQ